MIYYRSYAQTFSSYEIKAEKTQAVLKLKQNNYLPQPSASANN